MTMKRTLRALLLISTVLANGLPARAGAQGSNDVHIDVKSGAIARLPLRC